MRIVIDLQGAQTPGSRNRGIGRYSRSLTRSIIENAKKHEVLLALNGSFGESVDVLRREFDGLVPKENFHVWRSCPGSSDASPNNLARCQAAELYREAFLSSLNPDIVHVTSLFEGLTDEAVVSLGRVPARYSTSLTLYDLIPHVHRELYLSNEYTAEWYDRRLIELRRADLLLGISQSSCDEAIKYCGIAPDRVIAVGTAADPQFSVRRVSAEREKELRRRYGLKRPFIMYTGGIDHRKNIERLIQSFGQLPTRIQREHQLAIVCSVHAGEKERLSSVARLADLPTGHLAFTGYVPEDDLIDLYNICYLFVFPSWHEGFGLPALEAMSCGAPTIASNCSSLPEVVGYSDALFDPFDTNSIASSIERALTDKAHRQRLIDHASVQSSRFCWDEVGRRAVESFEQQFRQAQSSITTVYRPRLAFCSPLPPIQSGIADVSKEIIPHLSRHYRIDAIVHDEELAQVVSAPTRAHADRTIGHTQFLAESARYDRVVYNLGNSGFHLWMFDALKEVPGAVILHDFFLSAAVRHGEFLKGDMNGWAQKLYDDHGSTALFRYAQPGQPEIVVRDYPCNISILENSLGVIVHSEHAKQLASDWFDKFELERWRTAHLPRDRARSDSRRLSRYALDIGSDEFVVSSFGILNPFKYNDSLIRAFANSRLADEEHTRLVFVGGSSPEFEIELLSLAASLGIRNKVTVTGWASPEDYKRYLSASDVAVQLRRNSRGETSAAVLDCLNHGLPTIVNANGAMREIPTETIVLLQDEFSEADLVTALNRLHEDKDFRTALGESARDYVQTEHAPWKVAEAYYQAVESIYADPKAAVLSEISSIGPLEQDDAARLARAFGEIFDIRTSGTIYVDISVLVAHDAKTGIQRVVRNILANLVKSAHPSCRVEPVYFDPQSGRFVRAASFSSRFFNTSFSLASDPLARFRPGDIYVALDLSHHHSIQAEAVLAEEQRRGVTICYVVYDLLPIQFPELFPDGVPDRHNRWLNLVAHADRAICISRSVADELVAELSARERASDLTLEVSWFHLGAEMDEAGDDGECDPPLIAHLSAQKRPTFLAVGTIEPRKAQDDILNSFDELWREDIDCQLVLVGRPGWKMDHFVEELNHHPEWGKRLFWLERASDSVLQHLYASADCLVAASVGEGFGLPIVEAALHCKPVIARDIPVFREVAQPSTVFFGGIKGMSLAKAIRKWLADPQSRRAADPTAVLSWKESAAQFLQAVSGNRPYKILAHEVFQQVHKPDSRTRDCAAVS